MVTPTCHWPRYARCRGATTNAYFVAIGSRRSNPARSQRAIAARQTRSAGRRIRLQAIRALIAIRKMEASMSADERARWRTEYETVRAFLEKIMNRGA
jgi:hypothetical protein